MCLPRLTPCSALGPQEPPGPAQRAALLRHHTEKLGLIQSAAALDFSAVVAHGTDGFVSRDIEQLVGRAVHQAALRAAAAVSVAELDQTVPEVLQCDFEAGLEGFTAGSMQVRGVAASRRREARAGSAATC